MIELLIYVSASIALWGAGVRGWLAIFWPLITLMTVIDLTIRRLT